MLDLTNPVHRVNEIHSSQSTLQSGFEAIEQHAAFQKQSGVLFKELSDLVKRLEAVEHRVNLPCAIASMLADYRRRHFGGFVRGQGRMERTPKPQEPGPAGIDAASGRLACRGAAPSISQALDRLPKDLSERNLDGALQSSLSEPLVQLRDSLDAATVPSQVAAFPDRARQLVRNLGQRIAEEVAKKQRAERKPDGKSGSKTPPALPPRQVRVVRATEVASVTRVSTKEEWEQLNKKLDQRVRQLLDDGYDVELR